MSGLRRRFLAAGRDCVETEINGEAVRLDPSGVVYAPDQGLLVVSDLHLEKGAAFARRGALMPPYDTLATLQLLKGAVERHAPRAVLCLGDSFHDRRGAALMPPVFLDMLADLMRNRAWIWIAGNHDPEPPPEGLGGESSAEAVIGRLVFRHEPTPGACPGEVAGHLHPVARVTGGGRGVRAACFAGDGARMVMPSFGVTTGGLNVLDKAFAGLFDGDSALAHVIGRERIYPIPFSALSRG
jgi:uncharacterized protein